MLNPNTMAASHTFLGEELIIININILLALVRFGGANIHGGYPYFVCFSILQGYNRNTQYFAHAEAGRCCHGFAGITRDVAFNSILIE